MKISYNWLKDYIDVKMTAEKLAERLTMAGLTVDSIEKTDCDTLLEIEVTANRPDWLSYIGVAREVAAITGAKLRIPKINRLNPQTRKPANPQTRQPANPPTINIEDKKLCPRYTARIIRNVKVSESPAWLKTRLESMGLRPVNNIVDITNFCLFETGQPMHAFDLDKIEEQKIIVRNAKKGEKIRTIDGLERTLEDGTLIIADPARPIAIAGIMGGVDTEVSSSTKNILLEAAYFDPISIRRSAKKLGLSSESSYRFERKVDIGNIEVSSNRAVQMILDIAEGQVGGFEDTYSPKTAKPVITLRVGKVHSVLGIDIPRQAIIKILTSLGLKIKASSKDTVKLQPPSNRHDLQSEIDLIEEVSRIYGYDKIPSTIPIITEQPIRQSREIIIEKIIRSALTGLGFDEIITYSLLSKNTIEKLRPDYEGVVKIKNPLSSEQEIMRPSFVPGMLQAMLWNINRKSQLLRFFEIGSAYFEEEGKFIEKKQLSIGLSQKRDFYELKGVVEALFLELGIKAAYNYSKNAVYHPSVSAGIDIGPKAVGTIGQIRRSILERFDIKEDVLYCEICLDSVFPNAKLEKKFSEPPKYPSVYRDISIVVDKGCLHSNLERAIIEAGGAILAEPRLIDRYSGKQIPDGKISLTYRLEYRDPNKTLEEKDITNIHSGILHALEEKFGAKLRQ